MKKTFRAKTVAVSTNEEPNALYEWLGTPENLPHWYGAFCRSITREGSQWRVTSPRGPVDVRFVRNDHALLIDLMTRSSSGTEMITAIRVLANGEGAEVIMTLIQPGGLSDSAFHEHIRWAEQSVRGLVRTLERRTPVAMRQPAVESVSADSQPEPEDAFAAPQNLPEAEPESLWDDARPATEPIMQLPTTEADMSTTPLPDGMTTELVVVSGKRLFIGNLPFDWTDEQLKETFAAIGAVVSSEIARFRRNGRSRGFGFVEMELEDDARTAVEKLHGGLAGTRKMVVRVAKPKDRKEENNIGNASETPPEQPKAASRPQHPARSQQPSRSRRPERGPEAAPAPRTRRPFKSTRRTEEEQGIISTGGYEYFPRRASPDASSQAGAAEDAAPRSRQNPIEPSPYMEDTGDVENRGSRRPNSSRPPSRRPRRR